MAKNLIDQHDLSIELPNGSTLKTLANKVAELIEQYGPYPTIDGLKVVFHRAVLAPEESPEASEKRAREQARTVEPFDSNTVVGRPQTAVARGKAPVPEVVDAPKR